VVQPGLPARLLLADAGRVQHLVLLAVLDDGPVERVEAGVQLAVQRGQHVLLHQVGLLPQQVELADDVEQGGERAQAADAGAYPLGDFQPDGDALDADRRREAEQEAEHRTGREAGRQEQQVTHAHGIPLALGRFLSLP
jgi:hypothetical protein